LTDSATFRPDHAQGLNDPRRLETQVSEAELARLLALRGDEDLLDLGSGTGFYTDRMAGLTTGTVYAVELQAEMSKHYLRRGLPTNVRLLQGDFTALAGLSLGPASVDVACSILTWHEARGGMDLPGLTHILRPRGRLVVIDWRKTPDSWASGPPERLRFSKEEVAAALLPHFTQVDSEDLGRFLFAVTARRGETPSALSPRR